MKMKKYPVQVAVSKKRCQGRYIV